VDLYVSYRIKQHSKDNSIYVNHDPKH